MGRFKRQLSRLRHRRGHGVHSPYIYNIVREVFMDRNDHPISTPLYDTLIALGVKGRHSREIENLRHHCGLSTFGVDAVQGGDMVICSSTAHVDLVEEIVKDAMHSGTTVVILSPHAPHLREEMCERIIARHTSTTVNRRGYLIVFNNHLPKQHFIL
ncbi:MAG: hypothetical protein SNG10_03945 [Rikenellaceae bacterium]